MNSIQQKLVDLQGLGWTLASIADELGVHWFTAKRWRDGKQYPNTPKLVLTALDTLLLRKRIPKRKRARKRTDTPSKRIPDEDLMKLFQSQQQAISREYLDDGYYK